MKTRLSERPLIAFLFTFFGLGMLLMILAVFEGEGSTSLIGTYFLYGGIITGVIGFFFLNSGSGNKWDGYSQSNYMKNDEYFKKVRRARKTFSENHLGGNTCSSFNCCCWLFPC